MDLSSGRGISTNEEEGEDDDSDRNKFSGKALQWDLSRIEYVEPVNGVFYAPVATFEVLEEAVQSSCGERWHMACLKEV